MRTLSVGTSRSVPYSRTSRSRCSTTCTSERKGSQLNNWRHRACRTPGNTGIADFHHVSYQGVSPKKPGTRPAIPRSERDSGLRCRARGSGLPRPFRTASPIRNRSVRLTRRSAQTRARSGIHCACSEWCQSVRRPCSSPAPVIPGSRSSTATRRQLGGRSNLPWPQARSSLSACRGHSRRTTVVCSLG
jgi:hypothetical protein